MTSIIFVGDCRAGMRSLPEKSVHACITSPPYFGLRDYDHGGQIGLEATPAEFVAAMVEVFRGVHRILRDDGTVWLNLGDSYSAGGNGGHGAGAGRAGAFHGHRARGGTDRAGKSKNIAGFTPKQLLGIPWRVAFALQDDGWYLRQDIIWAKPNPMPESVKDRCTKAHEYIFLLSKSPKYYFDADAIKETAVQAGRKRDDRMGGKKHGAATTKHSDGSQFTGSETRNKRSVWTVTTRPFKGAHFATFPPALIEPCVLAGSPVGGFVLDPFGGAGTTGMVAEAAGRNSFLMELNPGYAQMAADRIGDAAVLA